MGCEEQQQQQEEEEEQQRQWAFNPVALRAQGKK